MAGRITDASFGGGISTVSDRCWMLHTHEADPPTLSPESHQPSHRSESHEPSTPNHRRRFQTVRSRISRCRVSGG